MSIDAVAVLRIADLAEPVTSFGTTYPVEHRGDASLVSLFRRFDRADLDEHALALRSLLGPALDAHADPRGILFFPDLIDPQGTSYDAIVSYEPSLKQQAEALGAQAEGALTNWKPPPDWPKQK
jgi:hypothetical protein